ncbi:MAG: hypothetical protein U5K76_05140 [Woeseiaceae bacterium]|nr:hypothetical protein [Woeseiaceae bacterium]
MSSKPVDISRTLCGVKYEIRGQLANRAQELEKRGYEIISLNIGNPGLFGFRRITTLPDDDVLREVFERVDGLLATCA